MQAHTRYRERGGEDAVVDTDAKLLRHAGHVVRQYTDQNPAAQSSALVAFASSPWNVAAQVRFGRALDEFRPDVLHVHNTWFALSPSILLAATSRRIPVVMTLHNYRLVCANSLFLRNDAPCVDCLYHGTRHAVKHRCYRGGFGESAVAAAGIAVHRRAKTWPRFVDRFLCLSEFAESKMVTAGIPQEKIIRIANNVPDPGERRHPPSASREVVFAGRISPEKGLRHIIDAWRAAPPPGLALTVLGDGPERAALQADAPDGVTFCGRVPPKEVQARLTRARAVVIPSTWFEGQPIVALEALAAGTPLILSDIGGLPEILGGTEAGWLSDAGSARSLADVLNSLGDSEVNRRGALARLRYQECFTPDQAVPRLVAAYRSAGAAS